jgi:hypothetical protein
MSEGVSSLNKISIIVGITFTLIILAIVINPKKAFVVSMIVGGRIVSPEGSDILYHYCFGNGDTLNIESGYLRSSPVVAKSMMGMKVGEDKKVEFRQAEDWRLSYALNPFRIKREKNGYLIYQNIEFDRYGKIHTDLNLGFTKIRVYDNIVHVFNCKPFVAVCRL